MRTAAFPLPRGEYTSDTRPESMQEMFNLRWQGAETIGTRSPEKLQTLPGLKPAVELEGGNRVRALHNAEGKLVGVFDDTMYRVSNPGVAIPLGALPGTGRVQIDHNQISLGNEVMAVNGSSGYLWNSVTDVFGRITDPGFPGGSSVRFVSGYFVVIEPLGRFAANSAPASGTEWNTFDRWTSEVTPDPLVAQGVRGNELLLLSTTSGEFFQATPNVRQPFRTKQINFKNVGAAGPHVTFDADGNIFWLGNDGVFYNLNGYSPARISTRMQEDAIKGLDWSRAFAFRWDTVVYWTFPDGVTLGWDYAQRQWHRRGSPGMSRWRPNAMARWNDRWIAGDFQAARLWDCNLEDRYWLEGSEEYLTRFSLPVVSDNGNALRLPRLELRMDTGQTPTVPIPFPEQPNPPIIDGPALIFVGTGQAFDDVYTATAGTPPYTFTVAPGFTLPAAGVIATSGVMSGIAGATGEYPTRIRVKDSKDLWDEMDVEIHIVASPVSLITNSHFYTGQPDDLELGDVIGWEGELHTIFQGAPDGTYATASRAGDTIVPDRFEIRKWDATTQGFVAHDAPATFPDVGPRGMAFHPTLPILACSGTHGVVGEDFILYDYESGEFVALPPPADLPDWQSNFCKWDQEGERLAIALSYSGDVVAVYDFEDGELTTLNSGLNPGSGEIISAIAWRPEDGTRYLAATTSTHLFVFDVQDNPPTLAASVVASISNLMGPVWSEDGNYLVVADPNNTPDFFKVYAFDDTLGAESLTVATDATIEQPPWVPTSFVGLKDSHMAVERQTVSDDYPPYIYTVTGSPLVIDKLATDPADMGTVLSAMAFAYVPGT